MNKLRVNLNEKSYDVVIEDKSIEKAGKYLNLDRRVLIVTDEGVPSEYAESVALQCADSVIVRVKEGEQSKSIDTFKSILEVMLENHFDRHDCVVAVGGGVCGDLGGFVASSYMRGVDFYNIPTTLLSQIDSSIGGKTAVNLGSVKNIVGAFYQPKKVLIDKSLLKTLSPRQMSNGYAEAIKMGLCFDRELFNMFYENKIDIQAVIEKCLDIKRKVVEEDEFEAGLRKSLNFGHTIGHGIEVTAKGQLYHGEAVGLGMRYFVNSDILPMLDKALKNASLPVEFNGDKEKVFDAITHDKKSNDGKTDTVFVEKIGSFEIKSLSCEELRETLNKF